MAGDRIPVDAGTSGLVPTGATPVVSSASGTNAQQTATLPAAAGKTTFLSGLHVSQGTATGAAVQEVTTTGLANNLTLNINVHSNANNMNEGGLVLTFNPPLPASALNTAITVVAPANGAGGTTQTCTAWGFQA